MPEAEVIEGLAGLGGGVGRVFAVVGVFDGLHRGHAYLVRRLVGEARRRNARPTVITFDHHPDEIIRGAAPPVLLDPAERLARLSMAGIDLVVIAHFDDVLRRTSYVDFVDRLRTGAELVGFLMTDESAFGHERRGTPDALARLGRVRGFEVATIEPLRIGGLPVSSSAIRSAIAAGDLRSARRLLGRSVAATGAVEAGQPRRLAFAMPVALPPAGRYEVVLSEPVEISRGADGTRRRRVARVDDGGVTLASDALHRGRLRVAFQS